MRLAMVCDMPIYQKNGKYYCDTVYYSLLTLFLRHFDSITLIGRKSPINDGYIEIALPQVDILVAEKITRPMGYIKGIRGLKKMCRDAVRECDAMYCRGIIGAIGQRITKKAGMPHVTYIGACVYETLKSAESLYKRALAVFVRRLIQKSTLVSDNAAYCSPHLQQTYPTRGKQFLWVEASIERCEESLLEDRLRRMGEEKHKITIGLVGQVKNYVKGLDTAIKAMSLLGDRHELRVLGFFSDISMWQELMDKYNVADRVKFCGILPTGAPVLEWLDNIDIYIQPSRTEGLPRASIEAMSRGCPLISSGVGGLAALTHSTLIHETEDWRGLADLIKRLSADMELFKEMSAYSVTKAQEYMPEKVDAAFEEICMTLINGGGLA